MLVWREGERGGGEEREEKERKRERERERGDYPVAKHLCDNYSLSQLTWVLHNNVVT